MGAASAQTSRTQAHARRFAAGLARKKMPSPTAELDEYLDRFPQDVLESLEGFAVYSSADRADEMLAFGHLLLVQFQLERIRYRRDEGYEDAARLIDEFQRRVGKLALTKRIDGQALVMLTTALHHAGIAASAELGSAMTELAEASASSGALAEIAPALEEMAKAFDGDPFLIFGAIAELAHAAPAQARAAVAAELARSGDAALREAAVLMLLDQDAVVRRAASGGLEENIANLSPASLRRLIAMRNWSIESERGRIDAVIRAARAAGIDCAPWPPGGAEAILASGIDGSGAQGFLIVTPSGRRARLSSVLLKKRVRDAWTAPPESRRKVESTLADAASGAAMLPVSRTYFDRAVNHQLALGLSGGLLPPAGLLQVAETVGAQFQPARLEWREALSVLVRELPAAMLKPDAQSTVLRTSAEWGAFDPIVESWFEDNPQVAELAARGRGRQRAKAAEFLLQTVLVRRRETWAEHFFWTALWLRETSAGGALPWQNFALLAGALADGRDLSDISLMRDIAARTIENAGRS